MAKKKTTDLPADNPRSDYWLKKADALWHEIIHAATGSGCIISNANCKGALEAHHLISKSVRSTRHSLTNGVLLCAEHHRHDKYLSAHNGIVWFEKWMAQNRPAQWAWVLRYRNNVGRVDYRAAAKSLERMKRGSRHAV